MGITPQEFVRAYVAANAGRPMDVDRFVLEPSGLDAAGTMEALADPALGRLGIQLMADLMAPEGSLYFDAIFGAYHGQAAIRAWLVPAMAEIEFIQFIPTAESVLFDDGEGGTSLDEWKMVADMGGEQVPLSNGVSVRRFRDGWITWACDVYDTGPFRQPPPPDSGLDAAPIPPWPRVDWTPFPAGPSPALSAAARAWLDERTPQGATPPVGLAHRDLHDLMGHPSTAMDWDVVCDLFHPTDSVYLDPIFGTFRGQAAIREWLTDVMPKVGNLAFVPVGPSLFDGSTSVQEFVQMAVQPDGSQVFMTRGTSVRRFADGWVTYAADYFDTAPMMDPEIQAAGVAAGSTITLDDIMKYRLRPA